jgi:hypothetical protein
MIIIMKIIMMWHECVRETVGWWEETRRARGIGKGTEGWNGSKYASYITIYGSQHNETHHSFLKGVNGNWMEWVNSSKYIVYLYRIILKPPSIINVC